MNNEIQSYTSLKLIKSILFVFVVSRIYGVYVISTIYRYSVKSMKFRLNLLYITIELFTFIRRNWVTHDPVEMISFIKFVTCDDIGMLAKSLTVKRELRI